MPEPVTNPFSIQRGALGSEYCIWRMPGDLVARMAGALDNAAMGFRKAMFDVKQGLICLMAPSLDHEVTGGRADSIIHDLCDAAGVHSCQMRGTRLRRPEEPSNTGLEPDCAFYIGERAEQYEALQISQGEACAQFVLDNPPDLAVDVEATHIDKDKMRRYALLGVPEVWRTQGTVNLRNVSITMLTLHGDEYEPVDASPSLGLTPEMMAHIINNPKRFGVEYQEAMRAAAETVRAHVSLSRQDIEAESSADDRSP